MKKTSNMTTIFGYCEAHGIKAEPKEERPHTVAVLENQLNLYKEALKKTVEERDELLNVLEKLTASLNQFIENHSIGRSVIADYGLLGIIGEAESIIAQIKDRE